MEFNDPISTQLSEISITDIKNLMQKHLSTLYDKVIIDSKQRILKMVFYYVRYKSVVVNRKIYKISFPLYNDLKQFLADGISEDEPQHTVKQLENDKIINALIHIAGIEPVDISTDTTLHEKFNFPLVKTGEEIHKRQPIFYIPELTFTEVCQHCNGKKYAVLCPECKGKHRWACHDCKGAHDTPCGICNASGSITCVTCMGKGDLICNKCNGAGCSECREGICICNDCHGEGFYVCEACEGKGKIQCNTCKGVGELICNQCYSDTERYGKIDCQNCHGMGHTGQMVYSETKIEKKFLQKIFYRGNQNIEFFDMNILDPYCKKQEPPLTVFSAINEDCFIVEDNTSHDLCKLVQTELSISRLGNPKVVLEELFYQPVPVTTIFVKHVLHNTVHLLTIIDPLNTPNFLLKDNPEEFKVLDIQNALKVSVSFFGKLFKTKAFVTKEDKLKKIRLMIALAKSDGVVAEKEKEYLTEIIGSLKEFTNREKKLLFDYMSESKHHELTEKDVDFSNLEALELAMQQIHKLAGVDAEMPEAEKLVLDKILSLMEKRKSKIQKH